MKNISCILKRWTFVIGHAGPAGPAGTPPSARVVHLVGQSSGVTDPRAVPRGTVGRGTGSSRGVAISSPITGVSKTLLADLGMVAGPCLVPGEAIPLAQPSKEPRLILWDFIRFNFLLARK